MTHDSWLARRTATGFDPCAQPVRDLEAVRPLTPWDLTDLARCIYSSGPYFLRIRQRLRPLLCPFQELLPHVPRGSVVLDVGCGGGLFLGILHALGRLSKGHGFDSDAAAIRLAEGMAARVTARAGSAPLLIERRDAGADWPDCLHDVVSMIDVIHHVPVRAQETVFRQAAERLSPGGILLYKDVAEQPRWRAAVNCVHDLWVARQWIHFVPETRLSRWACDAGLTQVYSASLPRLGFGHELRVYRKRRALATS